jgi:hypothetical protein
MGVVWPSLRDLPVLTELAVEITSCRGKGEGATGRKNVEKRLFLHGIHVNGAGVAVDERVIAAVDIFPNAAMSPFTSSYLAQSGTEFAPNVPPGQLGEKRRGLAAEVAFLKAERPRLGWAEHIHQGAQAAADKSRLAAGLQEVPSVQDTRHDEATLHQQP